MGIPLWVRRDLAPRPNIARPVQAEAEEASLPPSANPAAAARAVAKAESAPATQPRPTVTDKAATAKKAPVDVVATDWQALEAEVATCTACELHTTRTQTVFGVGNREADWMIIGEAPGAEEDRRGEPFVGRAGQLLDLVLGGIGRPRESVFIANILKCRPPSNRDPRPDEALACSGYLNRQIEWIKPKLIICVGRISAQNLLGTAESTGKLRGKVHRHAASGTPVIVTYHPAYLLRRPIEKRKVWADLKLAERTTRELATRELKQAPEVGA